jgi:cobalt-zinc-cadmium efflux system outer membrane protein
MPLALFIVAFAASLGAQEPAKPQALTVDEAVSTALANHPLLGTAARRVDAARGQRRQAALMPNPRLNLQSENTRSGGNPPFVFWRDTDSFAFLQQTIETAGRRGRRVGAAEASIRRAELESEVLRRQIALRVKQSYWGALGTQRIHELLLENAETFRQIVEYHEIRVREGAMAESDLLRVRLEADRIKLAANQARLDAERGRIQLFREMGGTAFPQVRFLEALEAAQDRPIDVNPERALQLRPELQLAQAQREAAQAQLELQKTAAKPNVDVLAGLKRTAGFNTLVAGLQLDLPLTNRNQGNIESAVADARAAESNLAATEALVRAEVSAAEAEYLLRRQQVKDLLGSLRLQSQETSRIAYAAYRLGGADLLRLLDAERLRIEIDILSKRAVMEYRQSIVALQAALGERP